jgi:hypothetical protein
MSIMTRAVYIGGFGNGKSSAEGVADALSPYYDDVDPFTFSSAMGNLERTRRAIHGADVFTHSAGMLAIEGTLPSSIESFSPPLPTTQRRLIGRTATKTLRMHTAGVGIQSPADRAAVRSYERSSAAEFASHPVGNFGRLTQIAQFDAVVAALRAEYQEIPVALTYTMGDEYYQLSESEEQEVTQFGIVVNRIQGIHDELVIRPQATLRNAGVLQRISERGQGIAS